MNIRWLIPYCIFLLYAQLSSGQQQSGHRYAVLVGIGNYRGAKGLDPLHADDDTDKLAELLRQQGWTVWLMNSYAPEERQPYGSNILGALGISMGGGGGPTYGAATVPFLGAGARTREDSVLFYYGGHGVQGETDGIDYIIPRDVQFSTTGTILKRTLINLKFVLTALNKTGAGNIIVFTDTCRTTARTRSANTRKAWRTRGLTGAFTEDPGPAPLQYERHFFLENSASDEQSSYEMDEQSSGVFTFFLRQALAQPQSSGGRCTTLASVAERARSGTINYVQQKLKGAQTPTVLADTSWAESFCLAGAGSSSDFGGAVHKLEPLTNSGGDYASLHALLEKLWAQGQHQGQPWSDIYVTQKLLGLDSCTLSVRTEAFERKSQTWSGKDTSNLTETTVHLGLLRDVKRYSYGEGDGAVERIDLNGPKEAFETRETLRILAPGDSTVESQIDTSPTGNMFPTHLVLHLPPNDHVDASNASTLLSNIVDSCRNR